ncbi:MAG: hydantoinase B/oxoprolinase family protein [Saprospiraceae bacterium]|nr:hydantoinase B/oxoprolinase family protein [Saprospiraceae bacterium]
MGKTPIHISNVTEKINNKAYGLLGKKGGKVARYILSQHSKRRHTPIKRHDKLYSGEELVMELPGGGGYGSPLNDKNKVMIDFSG